MILLEYLQSYRDVNIEGNTHALTLSNKELVRSSTIALATTQLERLQL